MKKVVLFGAGASYGSGDIIPYPPPLGKDLYQDLRIHFLNSWGNLPQNIDQALRNNFEDGMQSIWDDMGFSRNIPVLMKAMGYYFSEFRIDRTTRNLYFHFLSQLKNSVQNILFSTLNYDLIFEYAAMFNGFTTDYFREKYEDPDQIILWKLHGSCNLRPLISGHNISYPSGISFNSQLDPMNQVETREYCLSNNSLYPAMCLYMKSKPTQVGRKFFRNLQQKWGNKVLSADKILIIGVRHYPDDTYIWDPLTKTTAKIAYVGNKSGYDQWLNLGRDKENSIHIAESWDHCLKETVSFIS